MYAIDCRDLYLLACVTNATTLRVKPRISARWTLELSIQLQRRPFTLHS